MNGGYLPGEADHYRPPPGVLAGTVLRAARLSARATADSVADAIDLTVDTYLSLEAGILGLAGVPIQMLEDLKLVLSKAGAKPELVADLDIAAWGDLVLTAIADGENVACLLADPLTHDGRFAELLTWALTGRQPTRYALLVARMRLVRDRALAERAVSVLRMAWPGRPMPELGVLTSV
jgi:hypothetical protein